MGLVPVVLRFRLNVKKHLPDDKAETPHDRKTTRLIPPHGIQVWSGQDWVPLGSPVAIEDVKKRPVSAPPLFAKDADASSEYYWQWKNWTQGVTPKFSQKKPDVAKWDDDDDD